MEFHKAKRSLITGFIACAQAGGEVQPGDPALYAFSIIGPMVTGALFHEVFGSNRRTAPDLAGLAEQHGALILRGLLASPATHERG